MAGSIEPGRITGTVDKWQAIAAIFTVPRIVATGPSQRKRHGREEVVDGIRDDHIVVYCDEGRYNYHAITNALRNEIQDLGMYEIESSQEQ